MILTLLKPAPNVVHMYGLCTNAWDGRLRLVLELCEHGNVREYVKALPRDKVRCESRLLNVVSIGLLSCVVSCFHVHAA